MFCGRERMSRQVAFELPMGDDVLVDRLTVPADTTVWMDDRRVGHILSAEPCHDGHSLGIVLVIEDEEAVKRFSVWP